MGEEAINSLHVALGLILIHRAGRTPFTLNSELFVVESGTLGQLGDSQSSALLLLAVVETLSVSDSVLAGCSEGFSLQGPLAPSRLRRGVF